MQDFMDSDENPQLPSSIEVITELFSSMNVSLYSDTYIWAELQKGNLSEDDAIKYALALINSNNANQQLIGTRIIRCILSKENEIPYTKIIQSNVLPGLIQLIPSFGEDFAYEVLWIISNLAAGESFCNDYIISQRSLELINYMLEKKYSIENFNQIIWAIGNIAGTGPNYRDFVIQQIDLTKIVYFISNYETDFSSTTYQILTWYLHNLVAGDPLPDFNKIQIFVPFLEKIIINQGDEWILADALYSYATITDHLDRYSNSQLLVKICELLDRPNKRLNTFCLRILGNFATKKIDQDFVINSGLFPKLINFIDSDANIRKEAYWVMSNLVLDSNIYFSYLINSNFFQKFRKTLENDDKDIIKEAVWVVCNFGTICDFDQAKWVIDNNIIDLLLEKLFINSTIANVVFEGLSNYFKFDNLFEAKEISKYFKILENAKHHIGNDNQKLEKVLNRLNEMWLFQDKTMINS